MKTTSVLQAVATRKYNRATLRAVEAERDRLQAFVLSLLNPEENGHAVPAHIRDEARKALGRKPVETGGTNA